MLSIKVQNKDTKKNRILSLPLNENQLTDILDSLLIYGSNYTLKNCITDHKLITEIVRPDVDIYRLNELAYFLELDTHSGEYDYEKFYSIIELEKYKTFEDIFNAFYHSEDWDLIVADNYFELGCKLAEKSCVGFDYETFGLEMAERLGGIMTKAGYVYRCEENNLNAYKLGFVGDNCKILIPTERIDCSNICFFDDLEHECWELVEKYLEHLRIDVVQDDISDRISFDIAMEIQDYILDKILEAGVKLEFDIR